MNTSELIASFNEVKEQLNEYKQNIVATLAQDNESMYLHKVI